MPHSVQGLQYQAKNHGAAEAYEKLFMFGISEKIENFNREIFLASLFYLENWTPEVTGVSATTRIQNVNLNHIKI